MSRTRTDGSVMVVGERFEAWCSCPACERFACHLLRRATVADNKLRHETRGIVGSIARFGWTTPTHEITEEQVRAAIRHSNAWMDAVGQVAITWTREGDDQPLADASMQRSMLGWSDDARWRALEFRARTEKLLFEVIRTCDCGHSWGQT